MIKKLIKLILVIKISYMVITYIFLLKNYFSSKQRL